MLTEGKMKKIRFLQIKNTISLAFLHLVWYDISVIL